MKMALQAAYLKNWFNRVSKCTITQDICTRLLGLLDTFVYQSYNKTQLQDRTSRMKFGSGSGMLENEYSPLIFWPRNMYIGSVLQGNMNIGFSDGNIEYRFTKLYF